MAKRAQQYKGEHELANPLCLTPDWSFVHCATRHDQSSVETRWSSPGDEGLIGLK